MPAIFKDLTADHKRMLDIIKSSGLKWVAILPPHIAGTPLSTEMTKHDILEESHVFYLSLQTHQSPSTLSHSILHLDG